MNKNGCCPNHFCSIWTKSVDEQNRVLHGRDGKFVKQSKMLNNSAYSRLGNNIDCGLYAMAFITSYCFRQKLCFDLIFDSNKLRPHLLQCFENNSISEFPLTSKTISLRRKKKDKIIAIKNYCICNLPECFDDMVQCDKCRKWFHKYCINAPFNISLVTVDYFCDEYQK